jgi:diaminohydroxyphosphoribosylaminopyrimidine deaminase / 5-amino-6-(5-phosphoribosylamino)uracil reductase
MDKLWRKLLILKKEIDEISSHQLTSIQLILKEEKIETRKNSKPEKTGLPSVFINTLPDINLTGSEILSYKMISQWFMHFIEPQFFGERHINFLKIYLPYSFSTLIAKKNESSFLISHFAQSLDGKIATNTGMSKGIGNQENLVHSHRMRALCDGIMVGSNTYEIDKPQLTVRLVEGKNPVKIIISKNKDFKGKESDENIVWISSEKSTDGAVNIRVDSLKNGNLNCTQILKELYLRGIYSVYLEGGSYTTSQFLASGNIDIIQLHISPIILGSGITNFNLSPVNEISQGIRFHNIQYFSFEDEIMFVGELN